MNLSKLAQWLLIIGGLNWLLAVGSYDIAEWGIPMSIVKIVYILVGLAALYKLFTHRSHQ